jgi:hypothetical protein
MTRSTGGRRDLDQVVLALSALEWHGRSFGTAGITSTKKRAQRPLVSASMSTTACRRGSGRRCSGGGAGRPTSMRKLSRLLSALGRKTRLAHCYLTNRWATQKPVRDPDRDGGCLSVSLNG